MRRYAAGDRVVQAQYGSGTIVDVNEHHTVIEFDEHGTRRFSLQQPTSHGTQISCSSTLGPITFSPLIRNRLKAG